MKLHKSVPSAGSVGLIVVISWAGTAAANGPEPEIRTDDDGVRAIALVDRAGDAKGTPTEPGDDNAARMTPWSALGPFGGDVQDVESSPTASGVVLAGIAPAGGTGGTLFRSDDAGASWSEVGSLTGTSVFDVEFDPAGVAYIGTINGVWRSTDDGATWTQLGLGIGVNDQVFEVTIDPNDADTLWAGVADALGNQSANILRSTNGGSSWVDVTPPLPAPQNGTAIAINPNDSDNVVAGFGGSFGGGAVWVSNDGGSTWTNRSGGLPGNPINAALHAGDRILIGGGQAFGSQFVGLFESTNNGASWTRLDTPDWPNAIVNDIELEPGDSDTVYVASVPGVHRSTDRGDTWATGLPGTDGLSVNSVDFDPADASNVFVAASSIAVVASRDGGDTFAQSSFGIGALNVFNVNADPADNSRIALAFQGLNDGGIFTSTNSGQTWTLEPTPGTRWNTVGWAPDGTLYALSDGPTTIAPEALYRRETDGSWTSVGPDQGSVFESELFAIWFSQNDPDLILLGGNDFGVAGFEPTVWRSDDAASTWTKVFEGQTGGDDFKTVLDIEFVDDGADTVALAPFDDTSSTQEGGVLRSTDGGLTWTESSSGLPAGTQPIAVESSPTDPSTFFLGDRDTGAGNGGVHVTTDAGLTWARTGFVGSVTDLVSDPNDDQVLYILQFSAPKVSRSEDQGATFTAFDDGLALAGTSRDLSFADGPSPRLLMGSGTGVFARDLGAPCVPDLTGPGSDGVPDGILDADDFFFYLGLFAAGDSGADLTGPGGDGTPDGIIDADDFFFYLAAFAAGCP